MSGQRIGDYEVGSQLGAGGMGEVYRARDSKLKREVAIKVLPADVASDRERLARFQREAEVLASLNHPNIAHLYGIEDATTDGRTEVRPYIVMELVEGEDLAQRISRGPIPLDDALPIAKQIAEALEAAHEQGIIHRDLKPANIKVRPDGTVKVLDFGLAKAFQDPKTPRPQDLSASPTITSPAMTMRGVILGTAAYMAPEQAKGKVVDRRADVWAFGCVLFEMLTGKRTFDGEDVTDTIVAVMSKEPDWSQLPATIPANVSRLMRRCLVKDVRRRLRDIGDARLELDEPAHTDAPTSHREHAAARSRIAVLAPWIVAAALAIALAVVAIPRFSTPPAASGEVSRFPLTMQTETRMFPRQGSVALSGDGRAVAFVIFERTGMPALQVRQMSALAPVTVRLPEAVVNWALASPSWSPDGRYLVITAGTGNGGPVRRIDPSGSAPAATLAEFGRVALWGSAGTIVYGGRDGRVYRVAEDGGASTAITEIVDTAGELTHWPSTFLPDGRRFIFSAQNRDATKNTLYVASIDGGARAALPIKASRVIYAGGFLWFLQGTTLMAQRFDADAATLEGGAQPVAADVGDFAVSEAGALITVPRDRTNVAMTWIDAQGSAGSPVGAPAAFRGATRGDLSPDGTTLAFARPDAAGNTDIWQLDLARNIPTRLTFDSSDEDAPLYSPDGKFIIYSSNRNGIWDLYRRNSDGSGSDELLLTSPYRKSPSGVSPDGSLLLFTQAGADTGADIWALPLAADRKPTPVTTTRALEGYATFSPDGQWIAYCAGEAGEGDQIYVEPFPPTGARTRLSTTQGSAPLWSATGREIYYGAEGGQIMRVAVNVVGGTLRAGVPQRAFTAPALFAHNAFVLDKRSRVLALSAEEAQPEPPTIILNWPALLKSPAAAAP